jgi:hypothetical protein
VLEGEETIRYGGKAVEFTSEGGAFSGYLTSIEDSFEDDQASAQARRVLEEWRARYERDANLRGFVARQITARTAQ